MTRRTVDDQIRDRLYHELKNRQEILADEEIVDQVLQTTTQRLDEYVKAIADEIKRQQAAMGHLAEIRERQQDLAHHSAETANLGVNLADVFFRSDVNLFVKHLSLAEDDVIILGLSHDSQLLKRLREIISRIDAITIKE
jgi:hypothetical protein